MSGGVQPKRRFQRSFFVLVVCCTVALFMLGYLTAINWRSPTKLPKAGSLRGNTLPVGLTNQPVPNFSLRDQNGEVIDTASLRSNPYVLTFLYVRCPDVCPLIGQELRQAIEHLGPDGARVKVLAVSVDPRGDTPEIVRQWVRRQRLPHNFHYLVGSKAELSAVWQGYFARPQLADRPETSTHTATIWLIDRFGHRRTSFSAGVPVSPTDIAHDLRLLMKESTTEEAKGGTA
jgi:protein SCO1